MSYDFLAPVYATLERLTFGSILQQARCASLRLEMSPSKVLVLGDGDGRFLERAVATWPNARFVVVDQSAIMLAMAKRRAGGERVRFLLADVRDGLSLLEAERFDVVVSHFFLDCFAEETLAALVPEIGERLEPEGVWFVSDFAGENWWQRGLLWFMYRFFHGLTETEAKEIPAFNTLLSAEGFDGQRLGTWRGGFVVADVWKQ